MQGKQLIVLTRFNAHYMCNLDKDILQTLEHFLENSKKWTSVLYDEFF